MNPEVIRQALLRRYAPYEDGEWFTLVFFNQTGKEWMHFQVRDLEPAIGYVLSHVPTDTYSTMGVFGKEPGPGKKGSAKEVSRCAWLWTDLDCHNGEDKALAYERLQAFLPHPTVIYDSGRGYHAYWAISPVCIDMPAVVERNRWIASQLRTSRLGTYKADSVYNVDRIMRVPGTLNTHV